MSSFLDFSVLLDTVLVFAPEGQPNIHRGVANACGVAVFSGAEVSKHGGTKRVTSTL